MKVGVVGLGSMGHGIAASLLRAGHQVWGADVNPDAVRRLQSEGAATGGLAAALPNLDALVGVVLNAAQTEEVLFGATANPASTKALAAELTAKGGHFVDAPLGGTPVQAEAGQLSAMVGCDAAVLEQVRPVMDCWAKTITRIGPVGSGHKMKLLMNFIGVSYGALFSEVVVLGANVGIDAVTVRSVIAPSRMGNGFFDTFMSYVVDRNRDAHKFSIDNAAKDMRYLNDLAFDANMMNMMAGAAKQYYTHAIATGRGEDFVPMLSDLVAAMNGISLAKA